MSVSIVFAVVIVCNGESDATELIGSSRELEKLAGGFGGTANKDEGCVALGALGCTSDTGAFDDVDDGSGEEGARGSSTNVVGFVSGDDVGTGGAMNVDVDVSGEDIAIGSPINVLRSVTSPFVSRTRKYGLSGFLLFITESKSTLLEEHSAEASATISVIQGLKRVYRKEIHVRDIALGKHEATIHTTGLSRSLKE